MGWTSPALPFLTKCNGHNDSLNFNPNLNNCTLINPFTEEEGSWIGSLFAIGKIGIEVSKNCSKIIHCYQANDCST